MSSDICILSYTLYKTQWWKQSFVLPFVHLQVECFRSFWMLALEKPLLDWIHQVWPIPGCFSICQMLDSKAKPPAGFFFPSPHTRDYKAIAKYHAVLQAVGSYLLPLLGAVRGKQNSIHNCFKNSAGNWKSSFYLGSLILLSENNSGFDLRNS